MVHFIISYRIVILWNPLIVHVEFIYVSKQGIYVINCCLANHFRFVTIFVYGFNTVTSRMPLWNNLQQWAPETPWLIIGDFNAILSQNDKYNGGWWCTLRSQISISVAAILILLTSITPVITLLGWMDPFGLRLTEYSLIIFGFLFRGHPMLPSLLQGFFFF